MNPEQTNPVEEQEPEVTREEAMQFLQEQIEFKQLQLKLQRINRHFAIARMEELMALSKIAQMTSPPQSAEGDKPSPEARSLRKTP